MSLLITTRLDAACQVLVPSTFADVHGALTYWLSNPLLPAGRVAATRQLLESRYHSAGDKQALVLRLKKRVDALREPLPRDYAGYQRLLALLRHELITPQERNDHKPYLTRLRGAEIEWEYARLEAAIRQRQYAANPHADAA